MKQILRVAALLCVAGCASQTNSTKHPASAPGAPAHAGAAGATLEPAAVEEKLPPDIAKPPAPFEGEGWRPLFDGHTLAGWRETAFAGRGGVRCQSGVVVLSMGEPFTGITWTNDFPKANYEIALDAMRVMGTDFFCGLTVPVGTNFCSLIVGGWGGSLMGISSIDGLDASENETAKFTNFETGRWYRLRLRVTEARLQVWVDQDKVIDVDIKGRRISTRPGDIELSEPLGIASWETSAALREMKWRPIEP